MIFNAARISVFDRGRITDAFLTELLDWGRSAADEIFAKNTNYDIYNKVFPELGPYPDLIYRKAVLLHVLSVLAWFEASGHWNEGVDSSRRGSTTNENAEAGMWQVSWNNRKLDPSLRTFLSEHGIEDGIAFQQRMKADHPIAMEFAARLLRIDMRDFNRINNGPVRKGDERKKTWPDRPKLWEADESIYPWLSREAVAEIVQSLVVA